ncbi:hypothetical protein ACIBO1_24335 [Micromonospora sp. NPDC049903]|uniref:VMAP-C domain-containing protein n=1 Tax=Micromonospora sp. NPDC049903 TaxID=3364276 RepID=UPI0037ABBDEC
MAPLAYHGRLVDAILQFPGSRQRETRDRYASALSLLLDAQPDPPRSDDAAEDVAALVSWCAGRPDGLTKLVEAVALVEGPSEHLDRLRALESIRRPAEVLEPDERARVEALLAELDPATVLPLLRDLLTRWGPRVRSDASDPGAVVRLLEDSIRGADPVHPLYAFLSRLVGLLHGPAREDIAELVSNVGDRTGVPPEPPLGRPPTVGEPGQHHFVMRLAEDGRTNSRYLLHVWLVTEDGTWHLRYTSDTPHLLAEIRVKLDEQLAELARDEDVDVGALSVEFILPRALLGHDVDQWVVTAPGHSDPIGVHYPVVVRDLARMRNRISRHRWQQRCDSLRRDGEGAAVGAVRFEHASGVAPVRFAELMRNLEQPVCLIVLGASARHVLHNIGAWLTAGLPVIAWCRAEEHAARFDADIPGVLVSGGIRALPAAVWRLRQDAGGAEASTGHVGHHITLLWDEQDRLPPDERARLSHPAQPR